MTTYFNQRIIPAIVATTSINTISGSENHKI
jgi:hypothetical protein